MFKRILPSATISLIAAASFAGCGGEKLSGDSIEKLVVENLERGYPGMKVDCPDVDNKVGEKFTCDVTGSDEITKVEGSVAEDDQVNLDKVS